jgi:hypothetical protein
VIRKSGNLLQSMILPLPSKAEQFVCYRLYFKEVQAFFLCGSARKTENPRQIPGPDSGAIKGEHLHAE